MAVRKSEVNEPLTVQEVEEVAKLEKLIDAGVRAQFSGKTRMVVVCLPRYPDARIREELVRRYDDAGWNVSFENNPLGNGPVTMLC